MRARALIFDMDGTMIDSMSDHRQSWILFCKRHGIALEPDEVMRLTSGQTGEECVRRLIGDSIAEHRLLELVREKGALFRDSFATHFREIGGFCAFAETAAAMGLKLGVGSATERRNIDFAMSRLAMRVPPQAIVGGDDGLPGKPDPSIFLEVAKRLDVAPHECIVFEDVPQGIGAARRAGCGPSRCPARIPRKSLRARTS